MNRSTAVLAASVEEVAHTYCRAIFGDMRCVFRGSPLIGSVWRAAFPAVAAIWLLRGETSLLDVAMAAPKRLFRQY